MNVRLRSATALAVKSITSAPSPSVDGQGDRSGPPWLDRWSQWAPAAVLCGLMVAELARAGGFWSADATITAVGGAVLVAVQMSTGQMRGRAAAVAAGALALAAWWALRAVQVGAPRHFMPLGASCLAFSAAIAVVSPLGVAGRRLINSVTAVAGAGVSVIGLAGLTQRWFPMAMPAQHLWRLSSTLTYSNAAGLVIALSLMLSLSLDESRAWSRLTVCLCLAGLIATQSRGAYVAALLAAPFVPRRAFRRNTFPLLLGLVVGVVAVSTSPSRTPVPILGIVTVAASVAAAAFRPPLLTRLGGAQVIRRNRWIVLGVLGVVLVGTAALAAHKEIALRTFAPSDGDRTVTWSAAAKQFSSDPLVGVGPDRIITFHAKDGTFSHFVHDEYLQVGADSGVVGLGLLLFVAVAAATAMRRTDRQSSCAVAATVALAAGGLFDFDWHLPAIALMGGCAVALAISAPAGRQQLTYGRQQQRTYGEDSNR